MKRLGAMLLSLCLLLTCTASASEGEQKTYVMAGYDSETTYRTWETNLFFARMEEKTGIRFYFQQYSSSAAWQKAKDSMTKDADDLPDVLFKAELSSSECETLYEKGVLIDLMPLLEENCPNLWKLLTENPDYLKQISLSGGQVVALPYISEAPAQNCMWINKKWLQTLKLDAPTDLESLVTVLKAFKEKDPNQNGKEDEIPLAFLGPFDLKFLAHAFGLTCNDYNIFAQDGEVHFMPLEENFRPFIEWGREMYASGLFDRDGFTTADTLRTVTDSDATQTYGIVLTSSPANIMPSDWLTDYEVLMPLTYNGRQVYRSFIGSLFRGTFAVTSKCDDPAALLRWVDTLYGEEGAKLASVGLENVDYVVDGDGTWRVTDSAKGNSYFTSETLIISGATPPGASCDEFQTRYNDTAVAALSRQLIKLNQIAERPFPYYDLTDAQAAEITPLQNEIGYYVDMQIARWVLGEEEISDASFSAFEETLREKGLDRFMTFWQNILDNL